MYKMVFKLAPPYLCDLCPDFVSGRSCFSLRSARNLRLPYVRTDRHKKSFLLSSIKWQNSLLLEIRTSSSLGILKSTCSFQPVTTFFILGIVQRQPHTRWRLNFSALKYHLFQKNCCLSFACPLHISCNAPVEDPKHYFLCCPSFAALREKLFAFRCTIDPSPKWRSKIQISQN